MLRTVMISGTVLGLASAAGAQTPLQQALNAPSDGPLYSYDMTFENGEDRAAGRVDPSQAEGKRITITAPPEAERDEDFAKGIASMDKDADGDIWCTSIAEIVPPDAKLQSETDTTATYGFKPVAVDEEDAKIFKHLSGTVTVSKERPAILSLSMTALKPFKPVVVAKVNAFNMKATCAPGPDGRSYLARMDMKVSGKAMMKSFDQHNVQTISNLRALTATSTGAP